MKLKQWDVSVLGNKPVVQKENVDFYTSDTDAYLILKLTDSKITPYSATFTLFNESDSSLVSESVEVTEGIATYYMRPEIINHVGKWQLQVIFHTGKSYVSSMINFTVGGSLENKSLPKLEIVESWAVLRAQVEDFMSQSQSEITALEERVNQIITTPADTVNAQEIIDARQGEATLRDSLVNIQDGVDVAKLGVTETKKELTDYKAAMQGVNINQEAKQTATGYDVVSLPKTTGEGHGQFGLKGLTATNLIENELYKNVADGTSVNGVLDITSTENIKTGEVFYIYSEPMISKNIPKKFYLQMRGLDGVAIDNVFFKPNKTDERQTHSNVYLNNLNTSKITLRYIQNYDTPAESEGGEISVKNTKLINLTQTYGAGNEPTKEECDRIYADYFEGTKSVDGQVRVKSEKSALYINAPTMRSLPNGVADEIRGDGQGGYEFVQKVSDLGELLPDPIITPLQTSGSLITRPNGTVYVENAVVDAGMYESNFTVLGKPIAKIDTFIKYDFATDVQTNLDTTTAVIAPDGLSFTHTDLTSDDMVFVEYYYTSEQPYGEASVTYYDSRHTIKDTANGKHYKWDITSTNGVPSVTLEEV